MTKLSGGDWDWEHVGTADVVVGVGAHALFGAAMGFVF